MNRLTTLITGLALLAVSATLCAQDEQRMVGLEYWNGIDAEEHVTESGLRYKIRHEGRGRKPNSTQKVSVHYRGMLLNGVVFDSSYDEDEPIKMSLKSVIKGWREGIPLMPKGSTWVFMIPPELAYGARGSDGIPPNSTLIFEVELY